MAPRIGMVLTGLGALVLGGILGGALVVFLRAPQAPAEGVDPEVVDTLLEINSRTVSVLEDLTQVAQQLQLSRSQPAASERQAVGSPESRVPDTELLAAIERLTEALQQTPAGTAPGWGGKAPLKVPPVGQEWRGELSSLIGDHERIEAFSKKLRFSTYQQVLDRFGAPDNVWAGERGPLWDYELVVAGEEPWRVRFQFADGYLISVTH